MRIKTHELTGASLAWAVATVARLPRIAIYAGGVMLGKGHSLQAFDPTTNWADAGPLFERFHIQQQGSLTDMCRALVSTRFPLSLEVPDDLV